MATETAHLPQYNHSDNAPERRRLLLHWVRKLTPFRSTTPGPRSGRQRQPSHNPYGQRLPPRHSPVHEHDNTSQETVSSAASDGGTELVGSVTADSHSVAPTVCTDVEGARSIAPSNATSLAGTSKTVGGVDSRRGAGSTFSSPAPSVRSLTTTLTTIQSMPPAAPGLQPNGSNQIHAGHDNNPVIHFQAFPNTPASAIPPHLNPTANGYPMTYQAATANNVLTDNASILTLASSSKRRRRRSLDTDASVRALAPSSLWGGSRESLPLSILSTSIDPIGGPVTPGSRMIGGIPAERTSIYSTSAGFYARTSTGGDGASVSGGLANHGRADSASGSGGVNSPLVSPKIGTGTERKDDGGE